MRRAPGPRALALLATLISLAGRLPAQQVLDDFERPGAWSAVPGEGVELRIGGGPGRDGAALRLDFDFHGRGGYAVAHRELDLPLPENYEISFWIRGPAPSNTLEFKLIDSSGANVWWSVRRDFAPGARWTRIVIPRRHVTFAWGPLGGGELRRAAAIEIAITAGTGGKGTVWLDDLTISEREPVRAYTATPRASAEGSTAGSSAAFAVDGDPESAWRFAHGKETPTLTVDFGQVRVFGGVTLDWGRGAVPSGATLSVSADGAAWESLARVRLAGPKDYVRLPEAESRYLRLSFEGPRGRGYALRELTVQPAEWSGSRTPLLGALAADAPPGRYPRYLLGRQSYWTVVGSPDDSSEALLGEDGAVEVAPGGPSLEPFVLSGGRLLGWHDAEIEQRLAGQALPVPSVRLRWGTVELDITAAAPTGGAIGPVGVRYRAINQGTHRIRGTLYLALRPFQVNPPWQFLGVPGGPAAVGRIALRRDWIEVNGVALVRLVSRPARAGVAAFANGDIIHHLGEGRLPGATTAEDADSLASAALAYPFSLGAGDSADVFVVLPLGGGER
ncbi:MAG TPA: discoidin domain-containing protein, partial [Gemmatimonadales bacterium]|nr:discoidin domain-containing protein [Gemmatimonadales bacterium]